MFKNRLRVALFVLLFLAAGTMILSAGGKKDEAPAQTSAPAETAAAPAGDTAATVNGKAILKADLEKQLDQVVQNYAAQGMNLTGENLEMVRGQILDSLIEQELLLQEGVQKGYKADDQAVADQMSSIRGQFGSDEEYQTALEAQGFTNESLEADIRVFLIIREFLDKEFYGAAEVTDQETRAYYDNNPEAFVQQPEQIQASHILFTLDADADDAAVETARAGIQSVLDKVKAGGDFAELAREFSQGPSGPNGGDLGYFSRGQMVPEFEEAAFALKPGEVSGIVRTQFGFHIIKLVDHQDAVTIEYEPVKDQIRDYLQEEKVRGMVEEHLQQLRDSADIKVM